jgi:hypothetical protein
MHSEFIYEFLVFCLDIKFRKKIEMLFANKIEDILDTNP